jgi:hypothetical protein
MWSETVILTDIFVVFLSPPRNYGICIKLCHDLNIVRSADGIVKLSVK